MRKDLFWTNAQAIYSHPVGSLTVELSGVPWELEHTNLYFDVITIDHKIFNRKFPARDISSLLIVSYLIV